MQRSPKNEGNVDPERAAIWKWLMSGPINDERSAEANRRFEELRERRLRQRIGKGLFG